MALPSTIYRVTIELSDIDRGVYESLQATVARHPSETEERLVARLLAYALFYESDILFAKGVGAGDEPDLWVKGPDGRVLLLACGRTLPLWEQQHLAKLQSVANLTIVRFNQEFISRLVATLDRSIHWAVTISDSALYINVGDETFETVL